MGECIPPLLCFFAVCKRAAAEPPWIIFCAVVCSDINSVNLPKITRINWQARTWYTGWVAHNLAVCKSWCSFRFLFLSLHLILTGVCPITVNTVANAPRRGTASSALAMELDTVAPLVITVSHPVVSKLQWNREDTDVFCLRWKVTLPLWLLQILKPFFKGGVSLIILHIINTCLCRYSTVLHHARDQSSTAVLVGCTEQTHSQQLCTRVSDGYSESALSCWGELLTAARDMLVQVANPKAYLYTDYWPL